MNRKLINRLKQDYRMVNLAVLCLLGALALKLLDEYERMDKLEKYFLAHPDEAKHLILVLEGKESA